MLSREDNEILTRVGPGTLMGDLLRRYWIPACLSSEIDEPDGPPARVRLLGEDLVAFRDTRGEIGLIEEQCPHRGASLFYGRNEECGLRCTYHGWKFDVRGQCVDQRSELRPFAHRITITSYPVHESGGIVWAYLGPAGSMTPFRDFGTEGAGRGRRPGLPLDPGRREDPGAGGGLAHPRHQRRSSRPGSHGSLAADGRDRLTASRAVAPEAGEDGLEQWQGMNDLLRPDHKVPERLEFFPAASVSQVPHSPPEGVLS